MRGFSSFRRKEKSKRFPESLSPLPRLRLLCHRWRVGEISIMIGFHVPLWCNSPGDISLHFRWSWLCSSTTSAYALSAKRGWIRHPWCKPQDNVYPCTPKTHDVFWARFRLQYSPGVRSVHSWTVWGDTPVPGLGLLSNQNKSQVSQTYLKLWHCQHTRAVWLQVSRVWDYLSVKVRLSRTRSLQDYSPVSRSLYYVDRLTVPFLFRKTSDYQWR